MSNDFDTRQSKHRSTLDQLVDSADKNLKEILPAVNAEVTPPFALRPSATPDLVISVGSNVITNPDTGKRNSMQPIDGAFFDFASGTITFPAATGNISASPGGLTGISIGNNEFVKVLVQIDDTGNLVLASGAAAISELLAVLPTPISNYFSIGYIVASSDGGGNIQAIDTSALVQFKGSAAISATGGGSGSTATDLSGSVLANSLADLEAGLSPRDPNELADTYNSDKGTKVGLKIGGPISEGSALIYEENELTGSHELTKEITAELVRGSGVINMSMHAMRPDNTAIQVGVPSAGKVTVTFSGDITTALPDTKNILWAKRNLIDGEESYVFLFQTGVLEQLIVDSTSYNSTTDKTEVVISNPNSKDLSFGLATSEFEHRLRLIPFDENIQLAVQGTGNYQTVDIVDANALQVKRIFQDFTQRIKVPEQLTQQQGSLSTPGYLPATDIDEMGSCKILNMQSSPDGKYILLRSHHINQSPASTMMIHFHYSKDGGETFHFMDTAKMTMRNFGTSSLGFMGGASPYFNFPALMEIHNNGKFVLSGTLTGNTGYWTEYSGYGDLSDEIPNILGAANTTSDPAYGYITGLATSLWPYGGSQAGGSSTHHYPTAIGMNRNGDGCFTNMHAGNSSSAYLHRRDKDGRDSYLINMTTSHNSLGTAHFATVVGTGKHHIFAQIYRSGARWDYHETLEQDAVQRAVAGTGLAYGNAVGPSYPGTVAGAGYDVANSAHSMIDWFMNDTYIIGFYNRASGGASGNQYLAYRYIEHNYNNVTLHSKFENDLDGWTVIDGVPDGQPDYVSDFRVDEDGWTFLENEGRGISENDAQRNDAVWTELAYRAPDDMVILNHRTNSGATAGTFPDDDAASNASPTMVKVISGLTPGETYSVSAVTKEFYGSGSICMQVLEGNDISSRNAVGALPSLTFITTNTTTKMKDTFVAPAGGEIVLAFYNSSSSGGYGISGIKVANHQSGVNSGKVYCAFNKVQFENYGGAIEPYLGKTITTEIGKEYYVMTGCAEILGSGTFDMRAVDGVHLTSKADCDAQAQLGTMISSTNSSIGFTFVAVSTTTTIFALARGTTSEYYMSDVLIRETPVWSDEKQLSQNYHYIWWQNGTDNDAENSQLHTQGRRIRSAPGNDSHVFFSADAEAYNGSVSDAMVFEVKDITNHLGVHQGPTVGNYNGAYEIGFNQTRGRKTAYTFDLTGQEMANVKCFSLRTYQAGSGGRGYAPLNKDDKFTVRLKDTNVPGTGNVIQEWDVFMKDATHNVYPAGDIHYFNMNEATRAIMAVIGPYHLEIEASWGIGYTNGASNTGYLQVIVYSGNWSPTGGHWIFQGDDTWVAGNLSYQPCMSWHDHYIHKTAKTGWNSIFPNVNNSYTQAGMSQIEIINNKLKMITKTFTWDDDQAIALDHGGQLWGKEVVIDATDESSFKDAPEQELIAYDAKGNKAMGDPNVQVLISFGSDDTRSRGGSGQTNRTLDGSTGNIGAGEFAHGRKRQTVTSLDTTTNLKTDERFQSGKKMLFNGINSQIQIAENISQQQFLYRDFVFEAEFEPISPDATQDSPILSAVSSTFYPNYQNVDVDIYMGVDTLMRPCIKSGNVKASRGRGTGGSGTGTTEHLNTVANERLVVGQYYRLRYMRDLSDGFFKIFVSTGDALTAGPNETPVFTEVTYLNQNENGTYAKVEDTYFPVGLDGWQFDAGHPDNTLEHVGGVFVTDYTEDFSGGLGGWVEASDSHGSNSLTVVGDKMRTAYLGSPESTHAHRVITGLTPGQEYQFDADLTKISGAAGGQLSSTIQDGTPASFPASHPEISALANLANNSTTGSRHDKLLFTPTGTSVTIYHAHGAQFGTWDIDNITIKHVDTAPMYAEDFAGGLNGWQEATDSHASNDVSVVGGKMRVAFTASPQQPYASYELNGLVAGELHRIKLNATKISGAGQGYINIHDGNVALPTIVTNITGLPAGAFVEITGGDHYLEFTPTGTQVMLSIEHGGGFSTWDIDDIEVFQVALETGMKLDYAAPTVAANQAIAYKNITVKPNVWHTWNPDIREGDPAGGSRSFLVHEGHVESVVIDDQTFDADVGGFIGYGGEDVTSTFLNVSGKARLDWSAGVQFIAHKVISGLTPGVEYSLRQDIFLISGGTLRTEVWDGNDVSSWANTMAQPSLIWTNTGATENSKLTFTPTGTEVVVSYEQQSFSTWDIDNFSIKEEIIGRDELIGAATTKLSYNNDGGQSFQNPIQQFKSKSGNVTLIFRGDNNGRCIMRHSTVMETGFNIGCGNIQWQIGKTNGPSYYCEGYIGYCKLATKTTEFKVVGFQPTYTIQHPQMIQSTGKLIGMKRQGDGNGSLSEASVYYDIVKIEKTTPYVDSNDVQLFVEKDFGTGNEGNQLAYKETKNRGDTSNKSKTQGVKVGFSKE